MVTSIAYIYLLYSLKLIHIMTQILANNWGELLIGFLAFAKIIVNLTPTEKDNKIFGYFDDIVGYFVKDKRK